MTTQAVSSGTRLGGYEVVSLLGVGGMGEVYRAADTKLGRLVALKVLRPGTSYDPDRLARFEREARLLASLSHPNVAHVYGFESALLADSSRVAFTVMELVDGEDLAQRIARGPVAIREVLSIAWQVALALENAHQHGVIHRDLKPSNVMVQKDGHVKVLDFGLAKLVEETGATPSSQLVTGTSAGTVLGTAAYMSPEQAESKPLDQRSDIFSFGTMLYELCTGMRPFRGDSSTAVMAEVLRHDPPPLDVLRPDLPPELVRLVMRCLRKDPSRRVQSMADLRVALQELKEEADSGQLARYAPRRRRWRVPRARRRAAVILFFAVIALALGALAWSYLARLRPAEPAMLQPVPLTSYPGQELPGGLSPDGTQIAFAWDGERRDNLDIYVKLLGPGPPLRLTTDPMPDNHPAWSPNGQYIAFLRRFRDEDLTAVVLVSPLGGPERRLADFHTRPALGRAANALCWTSDSKFLLVAAARRPGEPNNLHRVSIDTGEIETVRTVEGAADGYASLDLTPDGHRLAAVRVDSGSRKLELIDLSSGFTPASATVLDGAGTNVGTARWAADGRDIVFSIFVNNPMPLYRIAVAGGTATPMAWVGPGASTPVIAPRGDRLVFSRDIRDTNIWRATLDPTGTRALAVSQLASSSFREVFPQYSPDGTRLAFFSNRSGSVQIWTSDADGSRAAQLTTMSATATTGSPRWSPDGRRIAFDSNADGGYHVYVISADGGRPRALTSGPSGDFVPCWSPDGRWIYFGSNRSGRLEVWRMPAEGGTPQQITRNGGAAPTVSQDGQWVYFTKEDGAAGLWRAPVNGGDEMRVVEKLYRYDYVPTSRGVYFVPPREPNVQSSVQFLDFATGAITPVVSIAEIPDLGLALSPDARQLLFTKIDYLGTDLMLVENFR